MLDGGSYLTTVYAGYEDALRAAQAVDFDDLIWLSVRLLETQPAALAAVHAIYRWISVDEYQDVNLAQYRLLRLLAAGGTDPEPDQRPVEDVVIDPVSHRGLARLGARVRPGWFAQTHVRPDLAGRTLLEILHRGDAFRSGLPREQAARALDRYELAAASEQRFDTLSGGQQARFQILLLELGGATLLLLDEPTDNLDLASAEALEAGLAAFEGTVMAVTHDRWFTRGFDRFLVVAADGDVYETPEPVWSGW